MELWLYKFSSDISRPPPQIYSMLIYT